MKKVFQKYSTEGLSLKYLAENNILPENLEFNAISRLSFPEDKRNQHALYFALREAYQSKDLKAVKKIPKRLVAQTSNWIEENEEKKYKSYITFWVSREDYKKFLKKTGEWPVDTNSLLCGWFGMYKSNKKFQKNKIEVEKEEDTRTNKLHDIMREVMLELAEDTGKAPKARETWNYIVAYKDSFSKVIQEITDDAICWRSDKGYEPNMTYVSFVTRHSIIKKEIFSIKK